MTRWIKRDARRNEAGGDDTKGKQASNETQNETEARDGKRDDHLMRTDGRTTMKGDEPCRFF